MGREVTFIHTSDIHLGRSFKYLGDKAKSARDHLNDILFKIADLAITKKVDIVFIVGDLFDKDNPDLNTINKFIEFTEVLNSKAIKIVILPGTHDLLSDSTIYNKDDIFKILTNVYIFRDENEFYFDDLSLTVYGLPSISSKTEISPINSFKKNEKSLYHVILAHGSVQIEGKSSKDDTPIELDDIKNSFADYIALGHWHQNMNFSSTKVPCFYSGSPELIDLDQVNSGFVIYGNLKEKKFENIKVGDMEFDEIIIDVGGIKSIESLLLRIKKDAKDTLVRKVILTGKKSEGLYGLDIVELKDVLKNYFYFLNITDNTFIDYKLESLENLNLVDKVYAKNLLSLINECDDPNQKKFFLESLEEGLALLSGVSKL